MIKRILAGISAPGYTSVVASYSRELSRRHHAEVTAISVTDMERLTELGRVPIGVGNFVKEIVSERIAENDDVVQQAMDVFVRRLNSDDIPCTVIRSNDNPYTALVNASRYHDLMIFGLQGLMDHGVTSEPPDEMIQLVEAGVRPILATTDKYRETKRVLIAYSGSAESAKAMRDFANLSLWPNASLKVVHFGKESSGSDLLNSASTYLKSHGFDVEAELVPGSPKKGLLSHAGQWNADLIVLGNSAKSLIRRRVFGETALNTIRESQFPLFLS